MSSGAFYYRALWRGDACSFVQSSGFPNATAQCYCRWRRRPSGKFGFSPNAWESIKMRQQIALIACLAAFGLMTLSSPVVAQQKTAKECRDEWRANKAANQANGVTEKAYVAQCRSGVVPATRTEAPAAPPVATPEPKEAVAGQKTAKACREEWRANKAANQANGVTEKAYVAQCRSGAAPAQTTSAPPQPPAPAPAQSAPPPAPAPTAATTSARPAPPPPAPPATTGPAAGVPENPVGANEFSTEAQAKARCPTDTVVWVNLTSKVYHFSGTRSYGNTKRGAYMCENDTAAAGMRAAKNETHP
jgi:hypothetical protein